MVGARSVQEAYDTTIGDHLRDARRSRHLTVDEIAHELRIPPHHLRSLEDGDLTVFSAEVYARGAYEKYAHYLGVEHKDYYHSFLRSLTGAREMVPLRVPVPTTLVQRLVTPYGVLIAGLLLAVLSVGSYLGWQVNSFIRLPELSLLEPQVRVFQDSSVVVRGQAEAESVVTVNGEAVLMDSNNTFTFDLPLHSGINVLQVEATGASGRTRTITQNLLVSKS